MEIFLLLSFDQKYELVEKNWLTITFDQKVPDVILYFLLHWLNMYVFISKS